MRKKENHDEPKTIIEFADKLVQLNIQQKRLLYAMANDSHVIVKCYRRCGLTTLYAIKFAYDITIGKFTTMNFFSRNYNACMEFKRILFEILEKCDDDVLICEQCTNRVMFECNGHKTTVQLGNYVEEDKVLRSMSGRDFGTMYTAIDLAAWMNSKMSSNAFASAVRETKVVISSTPHKKDGLFYNLWNDSIKTTNPDFKPIAMKWYIDNADVYGEKVERVNGRDVITRISVGKDIAMVCEALENGYTLTSDEMKMVESYDKYVNGELRGTFVD